MGSVAERLAAGLLAAAEEYRRGLRRVILDGGEFAALGRAVTEGLPLAPAAGAPPIALAGRHVDAERRSLRDRGFGHGISPQTAQFGHAAPLGKSLPEGPAPTQGGC